MIRLPGLTSVRRLFKTMTLALAVGAATLALSVSALAADKLYLKDGRVLEGKIVREGDGFLFFKIKVGSIEQEQLFTLDQVEKVERENATPAAGDKPKDGDKPADAKPSDASNDKSDKPGETAGDKAGDKADGSGKGDRVTRRFTGAKRVAMLNFGAPSSWQGEIGSTVGEEINAKAWRDVIPLLEKDKVEVVIVRINSGGGLGLEMRRFLDLFDKDYKNRFQVVGWVESAISAAAMSPWSIEEFYFLPEGSMGACTGWYGDLQAVKGIQLEQMLAQMEDYSRRAGRDPKIMRAMQIQEPLSCNINPDTGEVTWFQDLSGQHLVNRKGEILTFTAKDAVKYKFAKGVAATKEDLVRQMGFQEVEWVGQAASDYIDNAMREADKTSKQFSNEYQKYNLAVRLAEQLQDRQQRAAQVGIARRHLATLKRLMEAQPNFALLNGIPPNWASEQEEHLRELLK